MRIAFLMSSLEASADSSENTCNIAGAMLWQINSQNGVLEKPGCCFYLAEPSDAFHFVAAIEDLDVFHHLFADFVFLVAVGDLG